MSSQRSGLSSGDGADHDVDPAADGTAQTRSTADRPARWFWAVLTVPPAVVAVHLLALGAYAGLSVRPAADDWCFVGWIEHFGPLGMVDHYYSKVNGRLVNGATQMLIYSDGLWGARLLPFALVVTLSLGVFALAHLVLRHLGWRRPAVGASLVALTVSALTFFAGHTVYQVIYWPAGTVSHTLPAVLALWSVVLGLVALRGRRAVRVAALAVSGLTSFAIATMSEPFVVVSGAYAGAGLVLALAAWRDPRSRFPVAWLATWLGGLVVGFVLLLTSPGMAVRTSRARPQTSLLSADGFAEAVDGWQHTWAAIASQPAYYVAVGVGVLVGLLCGGRARRGVRLPFLRGAIEGRLLTALALLLPALLVAVTSFGVIAGLRQGYGDSGWRYERAWTNFLVPALLTAAGYGAAAGSWLGLRLASVRQPVAGPARVVVLVVTALLSTAGLASLVPSNTALAADMADRARAWDANDAAVQRQVREGRTVVEFTPSSIARSNEPFSNPRPGADWPRGCATWYYDAERLVPSKDWLSSPASERYRASVGKG